MKKSKNPRKKNPDKEQAAPGFQRYVRFDIRIITGEIFTFPTIQHLPCTLQEFVEEVFPEASRNSRLIMGHTRNTPVFAIPYHAIVSIAGNNESLIV